MRRFELIHSIIKAFIKMNDKKHKIIQEGKKETSNYFAIVSIISSFCFGFAYLGLIAVNFLSNSPGFFEVIGLVFLSFLSVSLALILFVYALISLIYQFVLNRKVMSFISLLFFLALIVGIVLVVTTV